MSVATNQLPNEMQAKLSQYIRVDTNSHSDSEGSTSGIGTATDNAYHILPASDSPVSSCPFSSSTTTSLVYGNGMGQFKKQLRIQNIYNDIRFFLFCICIGVPSAKNSNATNNGDEQMVSPLGIAKYLEDKLKAANVKHCETCLCASRDLRVLDIDQTYNVGTQTILQGDVNFALCLRCNSNLNSPSSTNSPFILKLVKSCDSIVSDAKSSISCAGSNEKLLSSKKDDLMVNPILGHTPISERAMKKHTTPNRAMSENVSSLSSQQPCGKATYASNNSNNNSNNSNGGLHEGASKHNSSTVSPDELPRAKESSRQMQRQNERTTASSSSSVSNRSSAALDGSKLFESFNRNLIKSIKVNEKCIHTHKRDKIKRLKSTFFILLLDRLKNRICLDHACVRFAFQMVAEMF